MFRHANTLYLQHREVYCDKTFTVKHIRARDGPITKRMFLQSVCLTSAHWHKNLHAIYGEVIKKVELEGEGTTQGEGGPKEQKKRATVTGPPESDAGPHRQV